MTDPSPLQWHAEALWGQLVPLLPGLGIEVVPRVGSTNTALLERARALPDTRSGGLDVLVHRSLESGAFGRRAVDLQPCLLIAEHQTAGRGRLGRQWQAAAGASLTFSISLPLTAPDWSGLSLAVGVALAEALDASDPGAAGPHVGLKWPNDLWLIDGPIPHSAVNGRKLGGILIETVAASGPGNPPGAAGRLVVVGIGLNVLPFDADAARTGFASLSELDPHATSPDVLARIALPLVVALQRFEREGFAAFADRFRARDILQGHRVHTTAGEAAQGIARGVTAEGALRVETPAGIAAVSSGEVSVRFEPLE
ncbi:MAG: biotin--[acetyl-CoA-carboxylase] ligase [Pseudomonadota bacterium]|nr:biotin--[acetyl-CoA-carboxylase] ligase [Pseudomonadota bacterium]